MQSKVHFDYAEVQIILCKYNANRMQSKVHFDYAEVQLI